MPLTPGSRVGPYEIVALLGAGGMGEVYRARDSKLSRDVALKILPDAFTHDPDRLARFRREAQVLASLNHPNIGHIHGFEDPSTSSGQAGVHALVLELVEGPTLADRIAQGPVPLDEALPIARQIAEALEAAHDQGVIHRDLKPANIKIRDDGTVKVLDFGLAKALDPVSTSSAEAMNSPTMKSPAITSMGVILGTAAYMAPEQARGKTADRRADIWAFGVVLYEMLAGRRAFDGETIPDIMVSIMQREPDWSSLPAATPARVRRVLRRCLEKDLRQRFRDIGDVRLEIVDALEAKPDSDSSVTPAQPGRARLWWEASALAVLLLAGGLWFFTRPEPERLVTRVDVVTPPTAEPMSFALSPDGRQIVFAANVEGGPPRLWLRSMDQSVARQLAGTELGTYPFWAPDARAIGFFAGGRLKRLELATGVSLTLANAPAPRGGTWNADGIIVFAPSTTSGLLRVSAIAGGPSTPATQLLPGQYSHRWPEFLPDGRRFLFSTFLGQPNMRGLYVASLDGGEPRRVMPGEEMGDAAPVHAPPGSLLILRQGVLLARRFDPARGVVSGDEVPVSQNVGGDRAMFRGAFGVSTNGVLAHRTNSIERRQLVWMDRTGRVLGRIGPLDENALSSPSLAPDGQRAAVSRTIDGNSDVWLIDVDRGALTRFTSDASGDSAPLWSPDGRQVVFRSARNGSYDLFIKPASGAGDERPLLASPHTKSPLDWSPDGRTLLYVTLDSTDGADVWALPMTGDRKPFPVLQTSFDEMDAHFSPDGRWIVYQSNESGHLEVYVRPFPGPGGSQLVSTAGGVQPRWGRDGREVFYVSPAGQLTAVPLTVAADSQSIKSGTPVTLFDVRLASGTSVTTPGGASRGQYIVAPDGRFLMNVAVDDAAPVPISIVLNWDRLLKK